MITLFTTFKEYGPREQCALKSWERSFDTPEIWVFTTLQGATIDHPYSTFVCRDQEGKPLVSSMFQIADRTALPVRAYINSDIVLLPNVQAAITAVARQLPEFMITSQRWDVQFDCDLDMEDPGWAARAAEYTEKNGVLHATSGMDIFCWRGDPWGKNCKDIPPYLVGCYCWDTDLMCMALESGIPVVDITQAVPYGVIHQNHRLVNRRDSPNARYNKELMGRDGDWRQRLRGTQHATHVLGPNLTVRRKGW